MTQKNFIKIGILITASLLILIWGINYLKGKSLFNKENNYFVVYEKIDGLKKGNAVVINGFQIGQVSSIKLLPQLSGKILVNLSVKEDYKIPLGSEARLTSSDLMGTKEIRIKLSDSDKYHQADDTLKQDIERDLMEEMNIQILPVKNKAENLMLSFDSVLIAVRSVFNENTRNNLKKSFESIKRTINNLENTTFNVDNIVSVQGKKVNEILANIYSISENLKNNNAAITTVLQNFSDISDSIAKADVKQTINNANNVLTTVDIIMKRIESVEGSLGQLLNNDTLYYNIENVTYNLNRLIRDLNDNPKRYINFSAFDLGRTTYIVRPNERRLKKANKKRKDKKNIK